MLSIIRRGWRIYLETRKARENYWAKYLSRPFAAVLVAALKDTRVTPDQVTIAAFLVSCAGAGVMLGWRSWAGLLVAVAVYQLAYVLDCVDGMLARVRGSSSAVGHLFDFMMDEIKAVLLLAAVGARLSLEHDSALYAVAAPVAVAALAAGLTMTTFTRRPELAPPARPVDPDAPSPPRSLLRRALGLAEAAAKFLVNYPGYIVYLALADRIDLFFWIYSGAVSLYAAKTFAGLALRLGRSPRPL